MTIDVQDEPVLEWPVARTERAWLTFGFDENLGPAARIAIEGMLALLKRELGVTGADALALASLSVDLHITQIVNGAVGVHAELRDGTFR